MMLFASGFVTLTFSLAGCADISADVALLDEGTARATVSYTTDEATAASLADAVGPGEEAPICENIASGVVTCVMTRTDTYAGLSEDGLKIDVQPDLQIKVSFDTSMLTGDLAAGPEQTDFMEMYRELFVGRRMSLSISGGAVTESNMLIDGANQAKIDLSLEDVFSGDFDLPATYYAVIRL